MNPQKITQQVLAFQKQSFENFQSVWQLAQTQTSSTMDRLLDQAWVPQENRQLIENWRTLIKKERDRYTAFVDRGFAIYEEMMAPLSETVSTNTKQNSTE
ncbi:hypothetical protein Dvar_74140 [Desulfosarcina variabilis str. Montpellier]|uniref:hypothetical protein n=1 Tax=Desulfosarcina variabilis TaxID=2300 RepID=UPI003AFB5E3C